MQIYRLNIVKNENFDKLGMTLRYIILRLLTAK